MVVGWVFWACAVLAAPDVFVEAPLPASVTPTKSPGRYHVGRSYEEVLDFYRRTFKSVGGVRWRAIISQPGLRAKHVESLNKRTRWEGINIYERQSEVKVYVIPRSEPAPGASKR